MLLQALWIVSWTSFNFDQLINPLLVLNQKTGFFFVLVQVVLA